MVPYDDMPDAELIEMLVEEGDLSAISAKALIRHVHRTMDSAYRGIIVLVYGRAWLALNMTGPLELMERVMNGRALRLTAAEQRKIMRLLDSTGLNKEQIARVFTLGDEDSRTGNSHKGVVPSKVPKSIQPKIRTGRLDGVSWMRDTKAPFTIPERRYIEGRMADLITPVSRSRTIRSLQSAAGHVASAAGVDHKQELVSQILLQVGSLKGVLMDEALQACYLPPGEKATPLKEEMALDALARWYIAWSAASAPRKE